MHMRTNMMKSVFKTLFSKILILSYMSPILINKYGHAFSKSYFIKPRFYLYEYLTLKHENKYNKDTFSKFPFIKEKNPKLILHK